MPGVDPILTIGPTSYYVTAAGRTGYLGVDSSGRIVTMTSEDRFRQPKEAPDAR